MQWSKIFTSFFIIFNFLLYNKSGDKMKKVFSFLILFGLAVTIGIFHEPIVTFLLNNVIYKREIIIQESNRYTLLNNFSFVQETDNFKPTSKQDLKNIIYTYLNRGWNNFSFYCETDIYPSCIEDVKELANDSATLSSINNFVHPYNSYDKLYITLNNLGKVTIETVQLYTIAEQNELNSIIDDIISEVITDDMSLRKKIEAIHDYIIENSVYDEERAEAIKNNKQLSLQEPSHKAIGPLIKGKALCSGYSDAMALFLNKLGIKNYKISSTNHVWNFVYVDGTWYHLDLTWDDPVVSTKENLLLHDFFLISTEELQKIDLTQHEFDKTIYIEAK